MRSRLPKAQRVVDELLVGDAIRLGGQDRVVEAALLKPVELVLTDEIELIVVSVFISVVAPTMRTAPARFLP